MDTLERGDRVLAYDTKADQLRWTPLQDAYASSFKAEMVRLHGKSFDVTCTQNHSWATKNGNANRISLRETDQIINQHIVQAARAEGGEHPMTEREAAILGWLATDGAVRMQKVGRWGPYLRADIASRSRITWEEIRALTEGLATELSGQAPPRDFGTYTSHPMPWHRFNIQSQFARDLLASAGLCEKGVFTSWEGLTPLVLSLSQPARAAMLDAMLKGDGSVRQDGTWVFGKKRKPGVMEAFEILATMEGIALGRPRDDGARPLRALRKNRMVTTSSLKREEAERDYVWCPTTEFGTWVMRLDGTITITGNTRAKGRCLSDAVNLPELMIEESGSTPDTRHPTPDTRAEERGAPGGRPPHPNAPRCSYDGSARRSCSRRPSTAPLRSSASASAWSMRRTWSGCRRPPTTRRPPMRIGDQRISPGELPSSCVRSVVEPRRCGSAPARRRCPTKRRVSMTMRASSLSWRQCLRLPFSLTGLLPLHVTRAAQANQVVQTVRFLYRSTFPVRLKVMNADRGAVIGTTVTAAALVALDGQQANLLPIGPAVHHHAAHPIRRVSLRGKGPAVGAAAFDAAGQRRLPPGPNAPRLAGERLAAVIAGEVKRLDPVRMLRPFLGWNHPEFAPARFRVAFRWAILDFPWQMREQWPFGRSSSA